MSSCVCQEESHHVMSRYVILCHAMHEITSRSKEIKVKNLEPLLYDQLLLTKYVMSCMNSSLGGKDISKNVSLKSL